jgi:glyceraldehyde-3-phosphate dehydrogenase/erythrose-4-phosphate dehydrogenase
LKEDVTAGMVNQLFKTAANNEYKGTVYYTEDPIVLLDFKVNTRHSRLCKPRQTNTSHGFVCL